MKRSAERRPQPSSSSAGRQGGCKVTQGTHEGCPFTPAGRGIRVGAPWFGGPWNSHSNTGVSKSSEPARR